MRTMTAAETAARNSKAASYAVRVSVENWAGAMVLLNDASVGGFQWFRSLRVREDVESAHSTAEITIAARQFGFSMMPLDGASPVNRAMNPATAPQLFLDAFRKVKVEYSYGAGDREPSTWTSLFEGRIDRVRAGSPEEIVLECRDMLGILSDTFFKRQRIYGLTPSALALQKGCYIWDKLRSYVVDDLVVPTKLNGYLYKVTVAGTTAATEPLTWPTVVGNTVTSGGVTFRCESATAAAGTVNMETVLAQMLNDSAVSGLGALSVPTPSLLIMNAWTQARGAVMEALTTVARLIGAKVTWRWDNTSSTFKPTLWLPDRAKTTPDITLTPSEVLEVSALDLDVATIRNDFGLIFSDTTAFSSDGKTYPRVFASDESAGSVTRYGRRYMEIEEDETSQIDTPAEAATMLAAAKSDLALPTAEHAAQIVFTPWLQVGDLVRFTANGIHYNADQDLALVAVEHTVTTDEEGGQEFTTTVQTRGKPSAGAMLWLSAEAKPGGADTHDLQIPFGANLSAAQIAGGIRVVLDDVLRRTHKWDGAEIHASESSGFTPSSSTLQAITRSGQFEIQGLKPGATYYVKAVPRGMNDSRPVFGEPTPEVSVQAGYAVPRLLMPGVEYGMLPVNGEFEAQTDAALPPDAWSMANGVWGTDVTRIASTGYLRGSGGYAVNFPNTATPGRLQSGLIGIVNGGLYRLFATNISSGAVGAGIVGVKIEWLDASLSVVSTTTLDMGASTGVISWLPLNVEVTAPLSAQYARIVAGRLAAGGPVTFAIDTVRIDRLITQGTGQVDTTQLANNAVTGAKLALNSVDTGHIVNGSILAEDISAQEAWIAPTFNGTWGNYSALDATRVNAGYMKDHLGFVHLRGEVRNGTAGSTIFTLPAGYRPTKRQRFPCMIGTNTVGFLDVQEDGQVVPTNTSNVFVSMNGITFDTRA